MDAPVPARTSGTLFSAASAQRRRSWPAGQPARQDPPRRRNDHPP